MTNIYVNNLKENLPRLLGLMDRNPLSKTYGSFDRSYWHLRRSDFSSSAVQQGSLVLAQAALLDGISRDESEKENLRQLSRAALQFTFGLQHTDGSLDEWYPQERGWAGPTGYVLYSVVRTLELLNESPSLELYKQALQFAQRAVKHLLHYEEPDVLANHQAMALLAVESATHFFRLNPDEGLRKNLWNRFYGSFCDEGWSLEYDGCDPGYQSATLSFMARLHRYAPEPKLKELAEKQIDFLKSFIYPDFSFAGSVGTRGTANVFFYAFEYWGKFFPDANLMAAQLRKGFESGHVLRPQDQEDHYLVYRLVEMAECGAIFSDTDSAAVWNGPRETKYWPKAGILRISTEFQYGVFNLKKGGTGKLYNLNRSQRPAFEDSGYIVECADDKLMVTSFVNESAAITVSANEATVKTFGASYKRPVFSAVTFLLFRFALLFVRNSKLALFLKAKIRQSIMVKFKFGEQLELKRVFKWNSTVEIQDSLSIKSISVKAIVRGFEFPSRVVPQSLYAAANSALGSAFQNFTREDLRELNSKNILNKKAF